MFFANVQYDNSDFRFRHDALIRSALSKRGGREIGCGQFLETAARDISFEFDENPVKAIKQLRKACRGLVISHYEADEEEGDLVNLEPIEAEAKSVFDDYSLDEMKSMPRQEILNRILNNL